MTAPLVHIATLERSAHPQPAAVLQQTGDNTNLNRRFSDPRPGLSSKRHDSEKTENSDPDTVPSMLQVDSSVHGLGVWTGLCQVLDKMEPTPSPDEGWVDAGWRVLFNRLGAA